jgi:hypothetical protein
MRHLLLGVCALTVAMLWTTPGLAFYQSDLICDGVFDNGRPSGNGFTVIHDFPKYDLYVRLTGLPAGETVTCRINCKLPDDTPYPLTDFNCGNRAANRAGTLVTISPGLGNPVNGGFPAGTQCREPFVEIFGNTSSLFCVSGYR